MDNFIHLNQGTLCVGSHKAKVNLSPSKGRLHQAWPCTPVPGRPGLASSTGNWQSHLATYLSLPEFIPHLEDSDTLPACTALIMEAVAVPECINTVALHCSAWSFLTTS